MTVEQLAAALGAAYEGNGAMEITGAAAVENAGPGELAFVTGRKAAALAEKTRAGCLLAPETFESTGERAVIRVREPRGAFARALMMLKPPRKVAQGVHPTAVIEEGVTLGARVSIGAHATVGRGSSIGEGSVIGAGCTVGAEVKIGAGCRLYGNVSIYDEVTIGDRAVIHSGCVIGADGFGFVMTGEQYEKFPQVGRVVIGNDVELGANTCVDRAALGVTEIGDGAKLDNMVHIAHNCRIGKHVVVAAQTGFSGGVVVEDYAIVGGQVGVGDKARIESRAVVGSGAGILTSKIVRAGQPVWGTPARPLKEYLKQLAVFAKLPEIHEELKELRRKVEELTHASGGGRA